MIGKVLIRGQYAPIIGRICMDQFMVDVTDIEGVSVMDEVTLVGHDGNKMLTAFIKYGFILSSLHHINLLKVAPLLQ